MNAMTDAGPSYDPLLRRATPLAGKLAARIRADGPITVRDYMDACLNDPDDGYYLSKAAIGRDGDFITAPEISQIFGELIGLWAAVVWRQFDAPGRLNFIELGPGRGTLMKDALRAAARVPGFSAAVHVVLVECNGALRAAQAKALARASVCSMEWRDALFDVDGYLPAGPTILIANEFLDVRPIRQFVCANAQWYERMVDCDAGGGLAFARAQPAAQVLPVAAQIDPPGHDGEIVEMADGLSDLTGPLAAIAARAPVAGLFIDYGHIAPARGETLQAVRNHAYEHPLTSPGEADLTAMVDFSSVQSAFESAGFGVAGLVTQAEFLGRLGAIERASALMSANPLQAATIEAGVARLMAPTGMGGRFKVAGVASPGLGPLPGL